MSLVAPLPAVLAGLVLFFVPGLVLLSLLPDRERRELPPDEAVFVAVSVSVMAAAWVGLVLAEAGRFSLVRAATLLALASLGAVVWGRRRLRWPLRRPDRWAALLAPAAVLALAVAFQARPSEYLLGGRDPGTYVAAMGLIGRTGGIAYIDPLVRAIPAEAVELFFRHPDGPDYSWGRFMGFPLERPETGKVVPLFFHLFPAFGAYLFQAMGAKGALATAPLFGILATLSVYFALRRLFGPAPALLSALLLASNVVQVWFARYPVSEGLSQFLIFFAFLAFASWEERPSAFFGVLAGSALGLSLLVRIDSALILVPFVLYVALRRARHDLPWRRLAPVLVPLALLALHTAIHAAYWSRKYVLDITQRSYWSRPPLVWTAAALIVAAGLVAAHRFGPRLVRQLEARREVLQLAVMVAVLLVAAYAYFLRPWLSAWAGADGNPRELALAPEGAMASVLGGLGFRRLAAHDAQSLVRFGWAMTPLGLALGTLGFAAVVRDWRPRYLFPVTTALVFAGFYFYKLRIWNDYFFAWRRFVPVVLPCLLGFAGYALYRMAARGGWRRVAAPVLAGTLAILYIKETARIAGHVDWRNSVRFVADVARRFGPQDVVIFEQQASIHLLSLPLWAVHGVNVLELARFNPDPERVNHLIRAWRTRWRNVYFVYTYRTDLCGVFLQRVEEKDFGTVEWERAYARLPRGPEPRAFRFTIARAVLPEELQVPPLDEVDIGGSDDFQVSGFYEKEGGYRWTGRCGSIYLPAAQAAGAVEVTASAGPLRPPGLPPAVVAVSLAGAPLGEFTPGPGWTTQTFGLPAALPPGPPVLRLDVVDAARRHALTWRPANELSGSDDTRDLGVMVDRVRVWNGPAARIPVSSLGGDPSHPNARSSSSSRPTTSARTPAR